MAFDVRPELLAEAVSVEQVGGVGQFAVDFVHALQVVLADRFPLLENVRAVRLEFAPVVGALPPHLWSPWTEETRAVKSNRSQFDSIFD